jgi:hypothetical protein
LKEDKALEAVKKYKPKKENADGTVDCDEKTYPEEMAFKDKDGVVGGKSLTKICDILIQAVKELDKRIDKLEAKPAKVVAKAK